MMIAYNLCYTTILGKFDPKTGGTSGSLGALPYTETSTSVALKRAAEAHQAWKKRDEHEHPGGQGCHPSSNSSSKSRSKSRTSPATPPAKERAAPLSSRSCLSPVDEEEEETPSSTTSTAGAAPGPCAATTNSPKSAKRAAAAAGAGSSSTLEGERNSGTRGSSCRTPNSTPSARRREGGFPSQHGMRRDGRKGWDPRCIHLAPNTAGFCHPSLRQGILPLMLREILETRVMIKGAMRRAEAAGKRVLARTLNARQFALKMISNVTYG